ncbi:hypothetical protein ACFONI_02860 [Aeromonas media]|uniref:hypothetical protein n=1 Tax=Aeromonas media TaxID=651 RepID=UPI00360E9989
MSSLCHRVVLHRALHRLWREQYGHHLSCCQPQVTFTEDRRHKEEGPACVGPLG